VEFLELEVERLTTELATVRNNIVIREQEQNTTKVINNEIISEVYTWLETGGKTLNDLKSLMDDRTYGSIRYAVRYLMDVGMITRKRNPRYGKEFLYYIPDNDKK